MSNKIKQQFETIELPPELHQRSILGIRQAAAELEWNGRRSRTGKRFARRNVVAASILGFIVVISAIFDHQVLAAIQKALQFIPGIGIVKEEDVPAERYILKQPVIQKVGDGSIVITGMMADEQMTLITAAGNHAPLFDNVKLINHRGTEYMINRSMASSSSNEWTASFWHQGTWDLKGPTKLIVGKNPEITIPLTLTKAETFDSYRDMGPTSTVNDVSITAIANTVGGKARISLVSQHPDHYTIRDYGIHGIHDDQKINVIDETGQKHEIEPIPALASPAREFYFDLSGTDVKNYILTIPEINVVYDENKSIEIPAETVEHLDKTFEIAGFPVTVTKTERISENELRIYVDLHYDAHAPKSLHNFKVDRMSHMGKVNEQTRALEYLQFEIKPNSKNMKLTLTNPEILIRGPWQFKFPSVKYFGDR